MTAKEEAKELVEMFLSLDLYDHEDYVYWLEEESAKKCALISIKDKIQALENHTQNRNIIEHYKEVEQEIIKL
jgi:hypothetical protein